MRIYRNICSRVRVGIWRLSWGGIRIGFGSGFLELGNESWGLYLPMHNPTGGNQ